MKPRFNAARAGRPWEEASRTSLWLATVAALLLAGAALMGVNSAAESLSHHREAEAVAREFSNLTSTTRATSLAVSGPTPGTELSAGGAILRLEPSLIALERIDSSEATTQLRATFDQLSADVAAGEIAIMTGQGDIAEIESTVGASNRAVIDAAAAAEASLHADVLSVNRWFTVFTSAVFGIAGVAIAGLVVHAGTQRRAATSVRERQEARYRALMQHSGDIISLVDLHGAVKTQSSSLLRVLGRSDLWLTGRQFSDIVHEEDRPALASMMERAASGTTEAVHGRIRLSHGDGTWRTFDVTAALVSEQFDFEGILLTSRLAPPATSEVPAAPAPVQPLHHPVSGLLAETLFRDRLQHALTRSSRSADSIALLVIQLEPEQALASLSGDARGAVMRTISGRLARSTRGGDSIAQLNDAELAIILDDADLERARSVADRVREQLSRPVAHLNGQVTLTANIGISLKTDPRDTVDAMLLKARSSVSEGLTIATTSPDPLPSVADEAGAVSPGRPNHMAHGETFVSFAINGGHSIELPAGPPAAEAAPAELDIVPAGDPDFDSASVEVQYLPVLALETGEIVELETFVRWRDPQRGFIPIEASGMAAAVTPWMLSHVCRLSSSLPPVSGDLRVRVGVNVSPSVPLDEAFVDLVARTILTTGVEPHNLQFEIPARMIDDGSKPVDAIVAVVRQLRDLGVRVAIDGVGAESDRLPDFAAMPVDSVRIDRSVVTLLDRSADRRALVRTIVERAQAHGVGVVGVGVETLEQAERLWDLGADGGQGPLFFRPVTAKQLQALFSVDGAMVAAD